MPPKISVLDQRSITVPVPATPEDSAAFADFIFKAQNDGYVLVAGSAIEQGQRDPVTTGLRLVYRRGA